MYVCGMTFTTTVISHARVRSCSISSAVAPDPLRRDHVRNITDIDDKIIRRAQENGEPVDALTGRFIRAMDEDAAALGIDKPDHEPRATQHVEGMLDMIEVLESRGLAYRAENGDVNYAVRKFEGYGKLSGKYWTNCAQESA